jgi:prepilin-type N-terminal cleavage/methylation domain-containing protein
MINRPAQAACRRGFSLAEVVVSTLLVGIVLVAAMNSLGATIRGRTSTGDAARAAQFAQQLMSEIIAKSYIDGGILPLMGPELGESTANRTAFDDVDDYHNWTASPLQDADGNVLPNSTGWRHSVTVEYVNPANPANTTLLDNGLKRITITITRGTVTMTRLVGLRSDKS